MAAWLIGLLASMQWDFTIHADVAALGIAMFGAVVKLHGDWVELQVEHRLMWEHFKAEIDPLADLHVARIKRRSKGAGI